LGFDDILKESIKKLHKIIDALKFHLIFFKIITGKGLEFDRIREYTGFEDSDLIDWNSFAKTNKLFVKVFKEERYLDAVFFLDVSNTMTFGTTDLTKNEYASILITTLAYASHIIGDRVGFVSFSDKIKNIIEPSSSFDSILQIAKILSEKSSYGGIKNWKILKTLLDYLGPESYVFFISDFINSDEETFDFILNGCAKFKRFVAIMLRDPLDSFIPEGIGYIYVSDMDTGETILINSDKIREKYNKRVAEEEKMIEERIKNSGADFIKIHTNEDFVSTFIKFLNIKGVEEWR
jgi:uncharacterized protein (DUF58 family)